MHLQLRRLSVLLLTIMGLGLPAMAQEVLQSDAAYTPKVAVSADRRIPTSASYRTTTLSLPFFDDFSNDGASPDTLRWAFHPLDVKRPGLSNFKGVQPPSKGVATFDGVSIDGVKYRVDLSTGVADTLASQPIDLSAFTVADSVYLSFFVERGGTGESPEVTDSLVVMFDSTGDYEYVKVWALKGLSASESAFQLYHVVLDSDFYFHSAFRFKFINLGSLNGELDQFHLDYVYLQSGRSVLDSSFSDVSVTRVLQSPMFPYTAVPRKMYPGGNFMTDAITEVSNVGDPASSANLTVSIADPTGNNVYSGTITALGSVASLARFEKAPVTTSAFSDQSANILGYGAMQMTAIKTSPSDAHPENDTLRVRFPMDSVLAIDDGVSDFGYGLTVPRAFCQQFEIPSPDTMVAVWMRFAPSIFYSQTGQSFDMSGKGFRLVVWDSLSVDSSLVETSGGMNVDYGTALNQFVRYPLIREVEVPTTFWVGMRQADGQPIGIGFDKNSTQHGIYFENSLAEFQLSSNIGSLMIRPEFKTPASPVAVVSPEQPRAIAFQIAPQPVMDDEIRLLFPENSNLRNLQFALLDLQGRQLQAWVSNTVSREVTLSVARMPSQGIYFLSVTGYDQQGRQQNGWEKLMIGGN